MSPCVVGPKRCYVLGAGFSKACGLPLARELTQFVFNRAFPPDDAFESTQRHQWLNYLQVLFPCCDLDTCWPDFEELITVIDEWEEYRRTYETCGSRQQAPGHFKTVLLRHLALGLFELGKEACSTHMQLLTRFVDSVDLDQDTIVSFNWDLLLENACQRRAIPVVYGAPQSRALRLAKPHGSINLAERNLSNCSTMKNAINLHGLVEEWRQEDRLVLRAVDPFAAANRVIHPFADTLVVEPSARKRYSSPWINLQWQHALDWIREADEVHIIGYSLPWVDFRPRLLLQLAGLRDRTIEGRSKPPLFRLIDPNANELVRQFKKYISGEWEPVAKLWEACFGGS